MTIHVVIWEGKGRFGYSIDYDCVKGTKQIVKYQPVHEMLDV